MFVLSHRFSQTRSCRDGRDQSLSVYFYFLYLLSASTKELLRKFSARDAIVSLGVLSMSLRAYTRIFKVKFFFSLYDASKYRVELKGVHVETKYILDNLNYRINANN